MMDRSHRRIAYYLLKRRYYILGIKAVLLTNTNLLVRYIYNKHVAMSHVVLDMIVDSDVYTRVDMLYM